MPFLRSMALSSHRQMLVLRETPMSWKYRELAFESVQRACEEAVRQCLHHGVTATELRQVMGQAWTDVLREQARWGAEEFARE